MDLCDDPKPVRRGGAGHAWCRVSGGVIRAAARGFARLVLRVFYRRIEVVGARGVPATGPVIFVLNHPNGLVDPLFILAFGPGAVSFLAKEPLFRTPLVRHFVRALDCLPVYRKQDGADPARNVSTLEAARELLSRDGSLALFPEGTTHDGPQLQPLKTGAARIALSARALMHARGHGTAVQLVPVGLYYPTRGTFRSDAAVVFGAVLDIPLVALDGHSEPPPDAVRALTAQVDAALRALTLNAGDAEHVALAATAARLLEDVVDPVPGADVAGPVHRRLALMQRILDRHEAARDTAPDTLAELIGRLREYLAISTDLGGTGDVSPDLPVSEAARHLRDTLLGMVALAPLIVTGLLENFAAYRTVGWLAARASRNEQAVVSTLKVLSGLLLFPLSWLGVSAAVGFAWNWAWAGVHLLLAPASALAALWFLDRAADTAGGTRVLWHRWIRPTDHARLVAEREAIVAQLLGAAGALRTDAHDT